MNIRTLTNSTGLRGLPSILVMLAALGTAACGGGGGGVAYGAHIGGFVAGVVLVKLFTIRARPARPRW